MYCFVLCLCGALLLSTAHTGNSTLSEPNHTVPLNHTTDVSKTEVINKTKLTLVSEGGTLLPSMPSTLPKQKLNSLITLDEELSKTKEKSVVPRKGVDNVLADINIMDEKNSLHPETNNSSKVISELLNTTKTPLPIDKSSNTPVSSASPSISTTAPVLNTTIHHKKPLILSAEALAAWDKKVQSENPKIQTLPSTETKASSQIPEPSKDTIVKLYPTQANQSHPGMIMPIVITILVVPMFAIVGYMALKRGQEAWKNRHYKRMDFLLDGMYND